MPSIAFNNQTILIISDVDETVADLYVDATEEMIDELKKLLSNNKSIFFVSGQGLNGIIDRIVSKIPKNLRKKILISHCSGAEVWGFKENGELLDDPFYSLYEEQFDDEAKKKWRDIIDQLVNEFSLKIYETMPVKKFKRITKDDPLSIMYEDRGPQITFEVVNGYDLEPEQISKLEHKIPLTNGAYDLRIPILERADDLFKENEVSITSRLGGVFAVDFAIKGCSKENSVRYIIDHPDILTHIGITKDDLQPNNFEIWGDKFSTIRGGTDRHMSEAVDPKVRSIDFREEDPDEFLKGYNIVVWDGRKHLHEGLLEYLQNSNL